MDIQKLTENPEAIPGKVVLEVSPRDLQNYSENLLKKALETKGSEVKPSEEYLTPNEMAEALKVSLVTIWSYDKKGITIPLRIGNLKRYRKSDLEKIMQEYGGKEGTK